MSGEFATTATPERPRLVVVGRRDESAPARSACEALADVDDLVVASVTTADQAVSTADTDCFVLAPPLDGDAAERDTPGEGEPTDGTDDRGADGRTTTYTSPTRALAALAATGVPVVVYADSATLDAPTAFDAGATDHVDAGRPDVAAVLRRRVEATLRARHAAQSGAEARRLLDAVFDHAPVHLYVKDRDGRHLLVTDAYVRDRSEYLGRTDTEIYPDADSDETHADDVRVVEAGAPILHKLERVLDPTDERFSYRHLRGQYDRVLNDDAPDDATPEIEWVLTSKVPWVEDGEVIGLIGVGIDVTERERTRRRLQRQTDRLSKFASIVSHDLRTPLSTAHGNLHLFRASGDESYLDRVDRAHDRMDALIEDVLELARQGRVVDDPAPIPLDRPVLAAWRNADTGNATLVRVPADESAGASSEGTAESDGTRGAAAPAGATGDDVSLGEITADEGRMQDLFENVFRNSVEHGHPSDADGDGATSERPGPVIRVGRRDDGGFYVADDGPGIDPGERDRVLAWGYTTADDGTGLGLGIVDAIAGAHGWTVSVDESVEGGARFDFAPDRAGDP
jgi:signal transduction histidine kinase